MQVFRMQALSLCPKTWKLLFLFAEHGIQCEKIEQLGLSVPDKWPIVDEFFSDLSYIFSHFDKFIKTSHQANLFGFWTNIIDCNIISEVIMPLRYERVIKPVVFGKSPCMSSITSLRADLKEVLRKISEHLSGTPWLDEEQMGLCDITLATTIAVLDYLGEVMWRDPKLHDLYNWYSKIKSRPSFGKILQQRCPGIAPHNVFTKIDF